MRHHSCWIMCFCTRWITVLYFGELMDCKNLADATQFVKQWNSFSCTFHCRRSTETFLWKSGSKMCRSLMLTTNAPKCGARSDVHIRPNKQPAQCDVSLLHFIKLNTPPLSSMPTMLLYRSSSGVNVWGAYWREGRTWTMQTIAHLSAGSSEQSVCPLNLGCCSLMDWLATKWMRLMRAGKCLSMTWSK